MLESENALRAIQYFYKDIDGLQVGNPLPFVTAYDKDTQILFNELMFDGTVKHIFYGNVTFSMDSADAGATTARVAISAAKNLDGTTVIVPMDIHKYFVGTPLNADFVQGTTKGIFATQIVLAENARISFDGYIFAIAKK